MKTLARILSHWQHVSALLAGVALFFAAPYLLRLADPTAGAFDAGYLHRPVVAAVYLLFGISSFWLVVAVAFPSIDKWADGGGFQAAFDDLDAGPAIATFLVLFGAILGAYLLCLALVPV